MNARRADIPVPGVLSGSDATRAETAFGVGREQVERDHLISHMLASLAGSVRDDVVFIGGTALARTHLPALRLSEDIDLTRDSEPVLASAPGRTRVQIQLLDGVGRPRW